MKCEQKTDNLGPSPSAHSYYAWTNYLTSLSVSLVKQGRYKTTSQNYFKEQIIYETTL